MSNTSKAKASAVDSLRAACADTAAEAQRATIATGQASRVYGTNNKYPTKKAAQEAKIAAAKVKREAKAIAQAKA
ncbi:hypothetical protein SARC_02313 [Sphaeroforma arctica JP610]|uniref:Uncharacterized protein n=1 Tax=Sphaeroforma arctica JP610 TaxID=667725 RepID=A0A0L0G906_9EUKA|nr:hypothetical protein SARC_02313 [Sphaeroforma arctica JP610]KNC85512.1 hypothetical protein SARC_02313 [Sphaeroforma arctica JP610]|eukprot:XP_014159414.1 hypothetical protein SARC_02313 [Sphaeroforma arctica JP610]